MSNERENIEEAVSALVGDIDYDIWKDSFNPDTAEGGPEAAAADLASLTDNLVEQLYTRGLVIRAEQGVPS